MDKCRLACAIIASVTVIAAGDGFSMKSGNNAEGKRIEVYPQSFDNGGWKTDVQFMEIGRAHV